jgi:hypothetical protein
VLHTEASASSTGRKVRITEISAIGTKRQVSNMEQSMAGAELKVLSIEQSVISTPGTKCQRTERSVDRHGNAKYRVQSNLQAA